MRTDRELWRFMISTLVTIALMVIVVKSLPVPIEVP